MSATARLRGTWANVIGNQLVWLCAVAGAGRGWQWPAWVAAALYLLSQLAGEPRPGVKIRLLLLSLACAFGVDGSAAATGLVRYAAAPFGILPPPWIVALWAAFAMTLPVSMVFLQRHWLLPAAFGLLLAPLAYLSAARGFSAVAFSAPTWQGLLVLGLGWSVALSVLCRAAKRWSAAAGE